MLHKKALLSAASIAAVIALAPMAQAQSSSTAGPSASASSSAMGADSSSPNSRMNRDTARDASRDTPPNDRTASNRHTPRGASSTGLENRATDVPADENSASDRGRNPGQNQTQPGE